MNGFFSKKVFVLVLLLSCSIVINFVFFDSAKNFYLSLNALRLDPLGLEKYGPVGTLPKDRRPSVLIYGDSRAEQWSMPRDGGFTFVNRGIGGQTSAQVLGRFEAHVAPLRPDFMVLQVGINDLKLIPLFASRKKRITQNCKKNIRAIIARANAIGTTVIVTTLFPLGDVPLKRKPFWSDDVAAAMNEVNRFLRTLESDNVILLDTFTLLGGKNGTNDYHKGLLHLNKEGYEKINRALLKLLSEFPRR